VTNARAYYTTRAAAGALAPGIPHALFGRKILQTPGAMRRGIAKVYLNRHSGMVRQHQARNLEILRCAIAHRSSMLRIAPE